MGRGLIPSDRVATLAAAARVMADDASRVAGIFDRQASRLAADGGARGDDVDALRALASRLRAEADNVYDAIGRIIDRETTHDDETT